MSELAAKLASNCGDGSLWLFVYGSLLWKPAFKHLERRRAVVHGWRRAFCLNIKNYRATPDTPGLMLALARGGSCIGAVFRLPDDDREAQILTLLQREIAYLEDLPALRWVNARSTEGTVQALAFYCAHAADADFVYLPEDEQARRLATAVGYVGSCAEYLYNTVVHFEEMGIRDSYLWRMQAMVAKEIDDAFADQMLNAMSPPNGDSTA
ncbi:gamma-glutamylcyclotransferase [Limibaculum sp. FT325]|uniref:gamma-glutamylcyclotransferase n=1 Tax=Thermohalobaculum sediminis TaxID=2939436 RepID=UPI0020C0D4CE|nr:gamma-glutamylcyclotransferase [Limibaculum sediminis]MCL5779320.1 gamma-glutamylcyclotransferase [Limibaculum sediminis]